MIARGVVLAVLAVGAARAEPCPVPGQTAKLEAQLFFGQSRGTGLISRRAWERFVADTVTPALPDGFTWFDAFGQWRDPATGTIGREPTAVLVVVADDTPAFRERIATIAAAYRRRFDQKSVGIVTSAVCGLF